MHNPELDLKGQTQASTYTRLLQISGSQLFDGAGNSVSSISASLILSPSSSFSVTSSHVTSNNNDIDLGMNGFSIRDNQSNSIETNNFGINLTDASGDAIALGLNVINFIDSNGDFINITQEEIELAISSGNNISINTQGIFLNGELFAPYITGSLFGTSSFAISSSNSKFAVSASNSIHAETSSFANNSIFCLTASFALTSSFVTTSINVQSSASFASSSLTSSFLTDYLGETIILDPRSGSISIRNISGDSCNLVGGKFNLITSAGANINLNNNAVIADSFGSKLSLNNDGTVSITGSTNIRSITGSLLGTSSYSVTSSWANNSRATTLVTASTYQITSSWSLKNVSSSFSTTASYALNYPLPDAIITVIHTDGTITNYNNQTEYGTQLINALTFAVPGDTIYLCAGTFDTTDAGTAVTLPQNVSLIGSGIYNTIIQRNTGDTVLIPNSNCYIRDLSIIDTFPDDFGFPVNASFTVTNCIFENVYVEGYTDAFFLSGNNSTYTLINCIIRSRWDHLVFGAPSGSISCYNCHFNGLLDTVHGWTNRGPTTAVGTINLYDTIVEMTGSSAVCIETDVGLPNIGQIYIYGGQLISHNNNSLIGIQTGSICGVTSNTIYNPYTSVSGTGPITYLDTLQIEASISSSVTRSIYSTTSVTSSYFSGSFISSSNLYVANKIISPTITSSLLGTASFALTTSFALTSPATTLATGSTYQITSSWANNSLNSNSSISSSFSSQSISSSYSVTSSFALNGGTTLTTASTYQITSSWSNNSKTTISSSWASSSISSSYAVTASFALNGGSGGSGTILVTGSTYQITSSWATNFISNSIKASDVTALTNSFNNTAFTYTKSLYTPSQDGLYRFDFALIGFTTSSWNTNSSAIYLSIKFTDEMGVYVIHPSDAQPINFSSGGYSRYVFSQLFSGKAGSAIEYYFDSLGGLMTGSLYTIAKSSIEKLA